MVLILAISADPDKKTASCHGLNHSPKNPLHISPQENVKVIEDVT